MLTAVSRRIDGKRPRRGCDLLRHELAISHGAQMSGHAGAQIDGPARRSSQRRRIQSVTEARTCKLLRQNLGADRRLPFIGPQFNLHARLHVHSPQ